MEQNKRKLVIVLAVVFLLSILALFLLVSRQSQQRKIVASKNIPHVSPSTQAAQNLDNIYTDKTISFHYPNTWDVTMQTFPHEYRIISKPKILPKDEYLPSFTVSLAPQAQTESIEERKVIYTKLLGLRESSDTTIPIPASVIEGGIINKLSTTPPHYRKIVLFLKGSTIYELIYQYKGLQKDSSQEAIFSQIIASFVFNQ